MVTWRAVALVLGFVSVKGHLESILLDKCQWTVTSDNKSISVDAAVPGGIYTDLRKANVLLQDILYRDNDIKYRWVSRTGWTYSTEFEVTNSEFLEKENQFLVFHGVDTVATVFLNDGELGNVNNMFVRYRFDVKDKLKTKNKLTVVIASPIQEAARISQALSHPVPPSCTPSSYNGECHVNMLRKMQASFAWDWGPAFPSVGIWKSVELEGYQVARIQDVLTDITYIEDLKVWHIVVRAVIETGFTAHSTVKAKLSAELEVDNSALHGESLVHLALSDRGEMDVETTLTVPAERVELWWPNGYGAQPLYSLEVTLSSGIELSTKTVKIGFRTVELIQDLVDPNDHKKGRHFYFQVNKVPIYSKGSNLIPVDVLPENSNNETTIRNLLTSTAEANMNMLRVWGGGVYMSDFFYETCDQLGILIWHDLMFACNNYPTTPEFLRSVETEITQAVQRLQHHACMAVWAGNNEMEAATRQHWYISGNEEVFFQEYADLYINTLKPIVNKYDPTRNYLISSPTNGIESEHSKYGIADNPYSSLYGDTHNYDYYANLWDPANAPKSRFCSEFGIQSLPQLSTLEKIATAEDLASWTTPFFQSRQHLSGGNSILTRAVAQQFHLNSSLSLEYFAYLSQIYQAGAIKTITEQMRRDKGVIRSDGSGHNMGALYWQLNDVWQTPSWSSIDYDGNWKMLHHFARKFFASVLLSPVLSGGDVQVVLLNDLRRPLSDVTVVVESFTWNETQPFQSYTVHVENVASNAVQLVFARPLTNFLPAKADLAAYYIKVSAKEAKPSATPGADSRIESNVLYLAPIKDSVKYLKDPDLKIERVDEKRLQGIDHTEFTITLTSQHISLFTWISIRDAQGRLSDNGFHMLGDKQVKFVTCDAKVTVQYILENISVMNIQSNTNAWRQLKLGRVPSSASLPSAAAPWALLVLLCFAIRRQR